MNIRHTVASVALLFMALPSSAQSRYTRSDVRFLQDMIGHHTQALVMAGLIPARTRRPEIASLGERITISERDGIAAMRRWLITRHEDAPQVDADRGHSASSLNGMKLPGALSEAEMMQLEDASDGEFDQLFLTLMIRQYEGAVTMVKDLSTTQGAGQEPELARLVSRVEADQRAEIARMQALLKTLHARTR